MFDKYSFKAKFHALIVVLIILLITAYKRSFSSLITVVNENKTLTNKALKINERTTSFNALKSEITTLNSLIGKEGISKEKVRQDILSFVANNSQSVSINSLQPLHEYTNSDISVFTNQLDMTGNFVNLSQLAYKFETDFEFSKVVSLNYFIEHRNNKSDILHLKIIFQNYENIN